MVVSISGEGVEPPVAAVNPTSISETVLVDETVTTEVTIDNSEGGSDLVWEASINTVSGVGITSQSSPAGGPDAFGYSWIDSDEPGGPDFQWEDISGTGINVTEFMFDDNVSGPYR